MKKTLAVVAALGLLFAGGTPVANAAKSQLVIGYLSGGEASPFVHQVTLSLRAEAKKLNVKLVECDSNFLADEALKCAKTLSAAKPKAVINWQFDPTASKKVCAGYKNLPTVTIDTPNDPCAKVFVGADNYAAGLLAGDALGKWAKSNLNCNYDLYIGIESGIQVDYDDKGSGLIMDSAMIAILYGDDQWVCSTSPGVLFPEEFLREWVASGRKGTLGEFIAAKRGGTRSDPHRTLTDGRVTRPRTLVYGVMFAMLQLPPEILYR